MTRLRGAVGRMRPAGGRRKGGAPAVGRLRPQRCLGEIDIALLAGGLGTRLRPVLGGLPKVLAPIAGRPFLGYLLDRLTAFGARRVVLCLGHGAEAVAAFLAEETFANLELVVSREAAPLGTAGALRHARSLLRSDPVLVLNGDTYAEADLCAFLGCHRVGRPSASLLAAEVEDCRRYGRVELDAAGYLREFVEKDPGFSGPGLVNAGAYLLSAALLDRIAAGKAASLERGVFAVLSPGSVRVSASRFPFLDIGTPESLAAAEAFFARARARRQAS